MQLQTLHVTHHAMHVSPQALHVTAPALHVDYQALHIAALPRAAKSTVCDYAIPACH